MFSIVMRIDSASYAFPKRFKFFLLEFHSVVHIFPHFFFFLFLIGLDGKGSFPIEDDSRGLVQRGQGDARGLVGWLVTFMSLARSVAVCSIDQRTAPAAGKTRQTGHGKLAKFQDFHDFHVLFRGKAEKTDGNYYRDTVTTYQG